jgi:DNA-binding HxlR family transcriptional regulator
VPHDDPLSRALAVIGDRWSFLVVRELGLGADRFETLLAATGAPRAVLAGRLRDLVAEGLVATEDYQEPRRRTRQRYLLTEAGRALRPVLAALAAWGEDHAAPVPHRGLVDRHRGCGGEVHPRLVCDCGQVVALPTDVLTEIRPEGAA